MYCPKCGWQNDEAALKCANCFTNLSVQQNPQQPQPAGQTQQMPSQPPCAQPQQPYSQPVYTQPPSQQQYMGPQMGQIYINYEAARTIPDHLMWSIIVTALSFLFCISGFLALPFGILAIVKSAQCSQKKSQGDYYGALSDSNAAKTWLIVSICLLVLMILFVALAMGLSRSNPYKL